jgi:hypothetical protein
MLKGHKMPPPSAALPCLLLPSSPHYPFSLSPHTRSIFLDRFVPLSASLFGVSIPIASGILSGVAVRSCTNPTATLNTATVLYHRRNTIASHEVDSFCGTHRRTVFEEPTTAARITMPKAPKAPRHYAKSELTKETLSTFSQPQGPAAGTCSIGTRDHAVEDG